MKKRILSTVLAVIMIFSAVALVSCGKKEFNYAKEDLSSYIAHKADYKTLPVEIQTNIDENAVNAKITENVTLLSESDKAEFFATDRAVADGDIVSIYFRAVTLDKDGNEVDFEGNSNFGNETPFNILLGADTFFVDGFESALVGILPSETSISAREDGVVSEDDLIVLEISGLYDGEGEQAEKKTYMKYDNLAVKLSETTILSEEIKENIVGRNIGEKLIFSLELDADGDKDNDTVVFAATAKKALTINAKKLELTFSEDYSDKDLAGEKVFFYVVVNGTASFDKANLAKLGFETEEQDAFGAYKKSVTEKLIRDYATKQAEQKESFEALVSNAIWEAILENATVNEYPAGTIDAYISREKNNLEYEFYASQNADAYKEQYKTLEKYAEEKYGAKDYDSVIKADAESFVKTKLALYSIAKDMGLDQPTKEQIKQVREELLAEFIAYYEQMYAIYNSVFGWGYTQDQVKVIAENNAQAEIEAMTETREKEITMKQLVLEAIFADYNTDFDNGLVSWTLVPEAEEVEE